MGEGPSHDVVIGKRGVRHEEIVEISVRVKGPKYSPMMKPLRMLEELNGRYAVYTQ